MTDVVIVLSTVPLGDDGERIARTLVEERLAACVNLLPPMTSFYRWQGALQKDDERQLLIKSTRERLPDLQARFTSLHPYAVPELLVLSADDGGEAYLSWVRDAVRAIP